MSDDYSRTIEIGADFATRGAGTGGNGAVMISCRTRAISLRLVPAGGGTIPAMNCRRPLAIGAAPVVRGFSP